MGGDVLLHEGLLPRHVGANTVAPALGRRKGLYLRGAGQELQAEAPACLPGWAA